MSQELRRQALQAFKSLHRTGQRVFQGDDNALVKARIKINEEYKKCKNVTDNDAIKEMIALSKAVENELKATVIQAKEIQPGKYKIVLRDEIVKLENIPFKECA